MLLKSKDVLGLKDMDVDDIENILKTATTMKYILETNNKKTPS